MWISRRGKRGLLRILNRLPMSCGLRIGRLLIVRWLLGLGSDRRGGQSFCRRGT